MLTSVYSLCRLRREKGENRLERRSLRTRLRTRLWPRARGGARREASGSGGKVWCAQLAFQPKTESDREF